ncbi:unnamed protein product [Bursaphelenchus okinawaensis]|uniref:Uncharacterized protein n=1 Tax=Bursaphelenchus okinawaensis TaxID=465554 RepID=A0A811KVZ3_9BILA|nr:unnamed protein product [Bursaphelenchus okinawaensis]CAG9114182.1 unnamed protein product [Bursaphelenchus okinawaensis]
MASAVMNPVGEEKMEEQPQETLASLNQPKTDEEKEIFDQCLEYLENMLQYDVQKYVPGEDHYFRNRAAYAVYGKNYTKSPAKFICFTLPNCKNGSERYVSVAKHDHAIVLGSLCRSKGDAKYTAIESFLRFNGYAYALEERKIKETILAGGTPAKRAHDEGIEQVTVNPAAKKSDVNPVEFDSNEQLSAGTQHYLITKPKNPSCLVNEFLASNGHKAAQYNVELVEGGFKAECTAKDYSVFWSCGEKQAVSETFGRSKDA